MIPRATYRIQFRREFGFADAARLAPYLKQLGISHLYASPVALARPGSAHGYDVLDPTVINPELGGEEGFRALAEALRREGLGMVLDIVPNHMAVGGSDNRFWRDVLQHGEQSRWAGLFDIDWRPPDPHLQGKLLAPVLGTPYAEALEGGDIAVGRDPEGRPAVVLYGSSLYPLRPEDEHAAAEAGPQAFNPADPAGRARLHELLERQHYRLAWWRTAGDRINWRRFFDITDLAGVRIETDEAFELVHALPLRLYAEGLIDGVRIDHVDGLSDPAGYCRTLRGRLDALDGRRPAGAGAGPAWIVVEKILAPDEALPADWGVDGTTGYDFMNEAALLLHAPEGEAPLSRHWAELSGRPAAFEPEERAARLQVLQEAFAGQLDSAARAFVALAQAELKTRDITFQALRRALTALLVVFPVYRTYATADGLPAPDRAVLAEAIAAARPLTAPGEGALLEQIAAWLEGEGEPSLRTEAARRLQQLSAPVSAKSVEDTAFYRYGRLISRNDVGSDPGRLAARPAAFHAAARARLDRFPHALLATATHDHKRGEDVTARLAVLSELPDLWIARTSRWTAMNREVPSPISPGDEYILYQTLAGAWPLELLPDDAAGLKAWGERLEGWLQKALREAKLRTSWAAPDETYEAGCRDFLRAVLDPERSGAFLEDLHGLVEHIAPAGALNGLAQALLRCTAPGTPDLYQGDELWDFSLVDPDNRRPVDYQARIRALDAAAPFETLAASWRDGRIKQALIARALALRARERELLEAGDYLPVEIEGGGAVAFLRTLGDRAVLIAAPIRCAARTAGPTDILPVVDQPPALATEAATRILGRPPALALGLSIAG